MHLFGFAVGDESMAPGNRSAIPSDQHRDRPGRFPSFAAGSRLVDEFPARYSRESIRDGRELIPPLGLEQGNGAKSIRRRRRVTVTGYGDSAFICSAMQRSLVQRKKCTVIVTLAPKSAL
jgi:hypothetical protein